MKDYHQVVLWLDYFNSNISRSEGRKTPLNQAVNSPTLQELVEAARRSGYDSEYHVAYHPKRNHIPSGYISIPKTKPKTYLSREISRALTVVRGEQRLAGR